MSQLVFDQHHRSQDSSETQAHDSRYTQVLGFPDTAGIVGGLALLEYTTCTQDTEVRMKNEMFALKLNW